MRSFSAAALLLSGFAVSALGQGLVQPSCSGGANTTTISGIVYAPNGVDPLPNVLVYIPQAPVDAFLPGVSCPVVGATPSGNPLVGATSAVDGSFTITNAPAGTNIPLVIVSGRWRRQLVIPTVNSCAANALPAAPNAFAVFPQNSSQGDIPKIAIATGSADSVECVLRKVGISDSEFTDPSGPGRINFYLGSGSPGSSISSSTPSETALMSTPSVLNTYDVLMLPCEGGAYTRPSAQLASLTAFANAGGRVYASHYAYSWMDTPQTFSTVAAWTGTSAQSITSGTAIVDPSFSGGPTLSTWLNEVGASTTPGQIAINTIRVTQNGVVAPTQSWLKLVDAAIGNPTMQFVWDTPVVTSSTTNQCGRVLFNEYHVENPAITNTGRNYPTECASASTPMTPQEKLLEYSLFELTNDGGAFTLSPATQDFGTAAIGFNSVPQVFTFTNNSTFSATVSAPVGSQDFNITGNNCSTVPGYGTCQIAVVLNPSKTGAETGTLTVTASGSTLTSTLTGNGIPDLSLSISSLAFATLDVGATQTQTFIITNAATGPVPVPALATTGDFSANAGCSGMLAAGATCAIAVTFKPTSSGPRTGTLTLQGAVPSLPATLTGAGVDFTFTTSPASGTVIAGLPSSTTTTTTPLAGFSAPLKLTCTTTAPGSVCTLSSTAFTPIFPVLTTVGITTTAQYAVVGYGGMGGGGWFSMLGLATGLLLWMKRRSLGSLGRSGLAMVLVALMLGAASVGLTGCSGKIPAQNANYTGPGTYAYTITATDGFLVHSATYSLTITAK